MERVTFLVDRTGQRVSCLLNPESLLVRRQAGVTSRPEPGGAIAGRGLSDDPVRFTGGGTTWVDLDLLFDLELAQGETIKDVRDLTRALWNLTENGGVDGTYRRPPLVRFLWGKSWNMPGIVRSISERFERFDRNGCPQRSWLRLRFQRTSEPTKAPGGTSTTTRPGSGAAGSVPDLMDVLEPPGPEVQGGPRRIVVEGTGGGADRGKGAPQLGPRAEEISSAELGTPFHWKLLAYASDIIDPLRIAAGTVITLPSGDEEAGR